MDRGLRLAALIGLGLVAQLAASCHDANERDTATTDQRRAPGDSCYRNISNPTGCPWTFASDPSVKGNIWFVGLESCTRRRPRRASEDSCTQPNGPCTVDAYCSRTIQYTYTDATTQGTWQITDQNGAMRAYDFYGQYACPTIVHSGSTGAVTLNGPANGDLSVGACTWDGSSQR